jgi:hypothetical protein
VVGIHLEVVANHLLVNRASLLGDVVSTLATGIHHTPKPEIPEPEPGLDPDPARGAKEPGHEVERTAAHNAPAS